MSKTRYMFINCNKLTNLNLSNYNTNNVMSYMFNYIPKKCKIIHNDSAIIQNLKKNIFS